MTVIFSTITQSIQRKRMNLSYFLTIIVLALGVFSAEAQTTTINTIPEGVTTFSLTHGTTTYMSLPLEADPIYSGATSAVTSNSISVADSPAPWTAGSLATAAQPYFVKFLTGPQTGRIILVTANTTNTLTLDTTDHTTQTTPLVGNTPSSFDVVVGNTFEVFPGETLATLFGTGTSQDPLDYLVGGANVSSADLLAIFSTATAPALSYFFDTSKGFWRLYPATTSANNTIIYPHSSFAITRRTNNGDTTYPAMGKVTEVPLLIKTLSLSTLYTSTLYPVDISLGNLNLGSNWNKGSSITVADNLAVWNGSANPGHFDTYYQLTDLTWRKYPDKTTNVSTFVIPAGSTVTITKRSSVTGPQSFLNPPLPYSTN